MKSLFVALVAVSLVAAVLVPDGVAVADPSAKEDIVRRTPVHGGGKTIGEVRIVRRGDETAVETVLDTVLLRRVVGKIRDKELANWPPDRPGYEGARAYLKALEEAQEEQAQRARQRSNRRDRAQTLLIDFSSSPTGVSVTLWDVDVEKDGDVFQVTKRRQLKSVPVTRDYVDRNMRLIVTDSFGVPEAEASTLLTATP
jgi:hypothetical protein